MLERCREIVRKRKRGLQKIKQKKGEQARERKWSCRSGSENRLKMFRKRERDRERGRRCCSEGKEGET